ncbi:MAG: methyltransferase domain-containing protein [Candidatus Rokubacteria bacterium]|nr:methyltransferase domain-containing protein [Candidatus Rokubacteria bacterium]MBI4256161.1 methyltransferase domain-containing protein [Candidatus Rokubacteria bacterium]
MHSYRDAAALMAAVELGLFTRVARGADTEAAIARALDLTPVNAERLVTACVALGLLVRHGEHVRNAPDVARFLVEGEPTYAGPWMLFGKPDWAEWGRLCAHLRRRDTAVLGKYAEGFTVERARAYHEATYSIGMGAARRFVRQVDLAGRRLLLDLGGGSGCYCIVAAQRHPQLRAVVFDLPPVVEVTREFIAAHALADRVTARAGDFTRDPLPAGADVIVMASNLPQYSREIIQTVVSRAFAALEPGGEMHLIGEMLDGARTGPVDPALWGLAEALWGSTGIAHSVDECRAYFDRAGFRDVTAQEFVPGVLTRMTGTRPA